MFFIDILFWHDYNKNTPVGKVVKYMKPGDGLRKRRKMMKTTKWMAAGLSAALAVSMFSGCGNSSKVDVGTMTSEEIAKFEQDAGGLKLPLDKNGTTITMLCDTSLDSNDSPVLKELRRRTGINVQLIQVPRATIGEKAKVMLASKNDMPDIFYAGMLATEINDLGLQGAFEPITDHLDELPNFRSIYIDNAKELKTEKAMRAYPASDGKMYMWPRYDNQGAVSHGMIYRKDIFDKNNIPMWNSPDTFYDALKKLKSAYPSSYPMASKNGVNTLRFLGESWGLGKSTLSVYYNEDEKQWKCAYTDPKYKEVLDFVKKLYDEKLVDPEFMTCTSAAYNSKMTQPETSFVAYDWIGRLDLLTEQAKGSAAGFDMRYGNPVGPLQKIPTLPRVVDGPSFKKSKNSVLAMKLEDYLMSANGAELTTCGVEGVTFNWNADKTKAEYIDVPPEKYNSLNDLEEKYGLFVSGLFMRYDERSGEFAYTERVQQAQDLMANKAGGGFIPESPEATMSAEEQEIRSQYDPNLRKAHEEFVSKYILTKDQTGDKAWEAWVKQAEQLGAKKIEDAYNAALARYNAKAQ